MKIFRNIVMKLSALGTTERRILAVSALILVIFSWTNWYFSPPKRLARLADNMLRSAYSEISPDDTAKMFELLKINSGGSASVRSSCDGSICRVSVQNDYFAYPHEHNERDVILQVETTLKPAFSEEDASGLLPQKIKWTEINWQWTVTFRDRDDLSKNVNYRGNFNQLNRVPTIDGSNTIASILATIAAGMRKELNT